MNARRMHALRVLALIVLGSLGCGTDKKRNERAERWDGGIPPVTPECSALADPCWADCFKRKASITCGGCCRDQQFLCDTQQKHSFEYCKSAQ
jgi:hypothetical protein